MRFRWLLSSNWETPFFSGYMVYTWVPRWLHHCTTSSGWGPHPKQWLVPSITAFTDSQHIVTHSWYFMAVQPISSLSLRVNSSRWFNCFRSWKGDKIKWNNNIFQHLNIKRVTLCWTNLIEVTYFIFVIVVTSYSRAIQTLPLCSWISKWMLF